ncbi:Integrator complex subunit 11 [Perkinsus chesapeaki]|uniref:Integrator complex subunit 11 n=1 Tax=Perkinsus chesapeaki TaxID=330153 RepID=A0A7J6MB47_PERCH|nr:Integrator complex subunit 11 [Perkinsus chesapeaki]
MSPLPPTSAKSSAAAPVVVLPSESTTPGVAASMDTLEITPLGAGQEVGRSCVILKFRGRTVMFDCGIHPAHTGMTALPFFDHLSTAELTNIDLLLVTHFHLDHSGAVPYLIGRTDFKGRTYMTHPTRPICRLLWQDYARVSKITAAEDQVYGRTDIDKCMQRIDTCTFHQTVRGVLVWYRDVDSDWWNIWTVTISTPAGPISFTAYRAGHVLGAAMFVVEIDGVRLLYTGDFSREVDRHLPHAEVVPAPIHALVVESTYGVQLHEPRKEREARFLSSVHEIVRTGGKCLLPVFALGRAQELLLLLEEYWGKHEELQRIPIFYATPMANKCLRIFETYTALCSDKVQEEANNCRNIWRTMKYVQNMPDNSCKEWEDIVLAPGMPCVVMAAPGMLQSGTSRELFEQWAPDPKNGVIITGYSVAGTLAHDLQNDPDTLTLTDGRKLPVRCSTKSISFSAHSDYGQTRDFIQALNVPHVCLVHGEQTLMRRLQDKLGLDFPGTSCNTPANTQSVEIQFMTRRAFASAVGRVADADEKPHQRSNKRSRRHKGSSSTALLVEDPASGYDSQLLVSAETAAEEIPDFTSIRTAKLQMSVKLNAVSGFDLVAFANEAVSQLFEDVDVMSAKTAREVHEGESTGIVVSGLVYVHQKKVSDEGHLNPSLITVRWSASPMADLVADSLLLLLMDSACTPVDGTSEDPNGAAAAAVEIQKEAKMNESEGERYWEGVLQAERDFNAEMEDIVKESEMTEEGFGRNVWPQGLQFYRLEQHKEMIQKKEAEEADARRHAAGDSSDASTGSKGKKGDDLETMEKKEAMRKQLREVERGVRKAYIALARECHPDKHLSQEAKATAEIRFKEIVEAYEVLSDERRAKLYRSIVWLRTLSVVLMLSKFPSYAGAASSATAGEESAVADAFSVTWGAKREREVRACRDDAAELAPEVELQWYQMPLAWSDVALCQPCVPEERDMLFLLLLSPKMDPAYSLSKSQLLDWVNTLLQTSLTKIEQCASGAIYCQIIDSAFPGRVPLKKVNWLAKVDYEYVHNYKILQRAFDQCNIAKHIDVDKLCKGKFQDNLEFLQWMKAFHDGAVATDVALSYDPVGRRQGCQLPPWAANAAPPSLINKENYAPRNAGAPRPAPAGRAAGQVKPRGNVGGRTMMQQQHQPAVDPSRFVTIDEYEELKESAVCLERERDFYFGKLRQVEILLQEVDVSQKTAAELKEMVQAILFASEEETEFDEGADFVDPQQDDENLLVAQDDDSKGSDDFKKTDSGTQKEFMTPLSENDPSGTSSDSESEPSSPTKQAKGTEQTDDHKPPLVSDDPLETAGGGSSTSHQNPADKSSKVAVMNPVNDPRGQVIYADNNPADKSSKVAVMNPANDPRGQVIHADNIPADDSSKVAVVNPANDPRGQVSYAYYDPRTEVVLPLRTVEESVIHKPMLQRREESSSMTTPLRSTPNPTDCARPSDNTLEAYQQSDRYEQAQPNNASRSNDWNGWNDWSKDWWYSSSRPKGPKDVSYVYYQVSRQYYILSDQWSGEDDEVPLSEFKNKLQTSPDFVWSDYCTKYFTVRHNLTKDIQRLLDTYEADRDLNDLDKYGKDAYETNSSYWKMRLDSLWQFLDEIYSGTDADTLETRWSQMWLRKGTKFLTFWSEFESTAREVARTRRMPGNQLTDSEMKCRLHAALPSACQKFLDERGYKLPGTQGMTYQEVVKAAKSWAQVHWDPSCKTKDVCGVLCDADPIVSTSGAKPTPPVTIRPSKGNFKKKIRNDQTILNSDNNKKILRARCGRCLDREGVSHLAEVCENAAEFEDQRCVFCGLCHDRSYFCPREYDSYGAKCGRCGKLHHSSLACKCKVPGIKDIQAISLIPYRGLSQVINISINDSQPKTALLDSGAMISVMHKSVLDTIEHGTLENTMIRLRTANCGAPEVVGKACALTVRFEDGTEALEDFVVVDSEMAHDLILSTNLLKDLGALWFLDRNVLLVGDEAQKVTQSICGPPTRTTLLCDRPREECQLSELCYIGTDRPPTEQGTAELETKPPELPAEILIMLAESECPPDTDPPEGGESKGLTQQQKVNRVLRPYQGHDDDSHPGHFSWELKPPTPRSSSGRFMLSIPWKGSKRPDDRGSDSAVRRARTVNRRLTPEVRQEYLKVIQELRDLGFTKPVDRGALKHIIPSMPVVRPGAVSTRVRLVLDASAQLNHYCYEGDPPNDDLYCQTLIGNLTCFRLADQVVLGDLSKAFHRIEIREEDQRFLGMCTVNELDELDFDQWMAMIFGANFAPSGLTQAVRAALIMYDVRKGRIDPEEAKRLDPVVGQLLDAYLYYCEQRSKKQESNIDVEISDPLSSLTTSLSTASPNPDEVPDLDKNTAPSPPGPESTTLTTRLIDRVAVYVDDSLAKGKNSLEAEATSEEIDEALEGHGFPSNKIKKYRSWERPDTTYLGYLWRRDKLSVKYIPKAEPLDLTAENMSRKAAFGLVMAFYDPLGLGVELVSCLRLLARRAFETSTDWDMAIDPKVATNLIRLARALIEVTPERTANPRTTRPEILYLFTDASGEASCQLLYDGDYTRVRGSTHLWTKVEACWTIPKKESLSYCTGLGMVADYVKMIKEHDNADRKITLKVFVDSELIIYRLRRLNKNKKIKAISALEYRQLRGSLKSLREIAQQGGRPVKVLHLPGAVNPADIATRPLDSGALPPTIDLEQLKDEVDLAIRNDFSFETPGENNASDDESTNIGASGDVDDIMALNLEDHFPVEKILELQSADHKTVAKIATINTTPEADRPASLRLYHMEGEILYYHGVTSVVNEKRRSHQVPVVPMSNDVIKLIWELHDSWGHPDPSKIISVYSQHYYTPQLRRLVRQIENTCSTCQRTKRRGCVRRAFGVVRPSGLVFDAGQVWCMDFAGPFLETSSNATHGRKKWVLTLMCPSSYQTIYEVMLSTRTEVVEAATQKLFALMGPPFAVIFDPGSTFHSSHYLRFLDNNNIAYATLPRDCQHYGGLFERFHGILLRQIRSRLMDAETKEQEVTIEEVVASSVSVMNRLPLQEMGGLTPHELFFCRKPRYPTGLGCTSEDQEGRRRLSEWLPGLMELEKDKLLDDLTEICQDVSSRRCESMVDYFDYWLERSDRIRNRMAKAPLKRGPTVSFKIGDMVLRYKHGNLKQQGVWIGPYKVMKVNSSGTVYKLSKMDGTPLKYLESIFNLKRYEDPQKVIDSYGYLLPEEGDDEEELVNPDEDHMYFDDIFDGIDEDERVLREILRL